MFLWVCFLNLQTHSGAPKWPLNQNFQLLFKLNQVRADGKSSQKKLAAVNLEALPL